MATVTITFVDSTKIPGQVDIDLESNPPIDDINTLTDAQMAARLALAALVSVGTLTEAPTDDIKLDA